MLKYISLVVLLKGGNRCSGISPTKKGSEGGVAICNEW